MQTKSWNSVSDREGSTTSPPLWPPLLFPSLCILCSHTGSSLFSTSRTCSGPESFHGWFPSSAVLFLKTSAWPTPWHQQGLLQPPFLGLRPPQTLRHLLYFLHGTCHSLTSCILHFSFVLIIHLPLKNVSSTSSEVPSIFYFVFFCCITNPQNTIWHIVNRKCVLNKWTFARQKAKIKAHLKKRHFWPNCSILITNTDSHSTILPFSREAAT